MKSIKINSKMAYTSYNAANAPTTSQKNSYFYHMPIVTARIPATAEAQFAELVKQLGGEVVSAKDTRAEKKEKLLKQISEGLKEVKAIREGKLKPLSMSDLLDSE